MYPWVQVAFYLTENLEIYDAIYWKGGLILFLRFRNKAGKLLKGTSTRQKNTELNHLVKNH